MDSMRYAHSEGHTDVCYSDDSKFIITCGCEGDVRVWNGIDDVDQQDLCVGERAWSIAQKGDSLFVGTDTNTVQIYTFPKLANDGIISRFTAPATQIQVSSDGKTVAACSCDMEIHVVDVESMQSTKLIDHKAPILSISLDPQSKYLVSSGCDGTVKVWNISTRGIVKQWDCLKKSNSFEHKDSLCRMDFNLDGSLLALPVGEAVKIFERDSWNQVKTYSNITSSTFNITRFSSCGKLLAAGTITGDLFVWEVCTDRIVTSHGDLSKQCVTGLSWKNDSKSFVFVNSAGQLGNLEVPEPPQYKTPEEDVASLCTDEAPIPEPVFDDDDDDENVISLDKIKSQNAFHGSHSSLASNSPKGDRDDASVAGSLKYSSPVSELQEPFQPSSTPLHLQERFMVWNCHGIVRQFNSEGAEDIDIEYHDTTRNHGLRLNNIARHTMATLTLKAAVLACPKSDDGPSKVVCVLMKSWDGSKEWDCAMPDDEEVIGLAAGDSWVAVVCDSLVLRLFTIDGTQVDLTSLPGPFVAATGNGSNLTVVFHSGVGIDSQQSLSYMEIVVDSSSKLMTVASPKPLPLAPKSLLRWIGYSDEDSLCTLDSCGVLRILYKDQWRPLCSLDNQFKSKFDHYFVVGVNEAAQNIRCILCKGSYYPPVIPKPLVNEIKWQIPLCELDSEKGKLEEEHLRNRIVAANASETDSREGQASVEKTISITIMKLFALACKSGLESRALTLCESMPSVEVVKLASKYAAKIGRQHLANKVNDIASTMSQPSFALREELLSYKSSETPEKVLPSDTYSQDMFEDSHAPNENRENLILKMQKLQKRKKECVSPKPLRILKTDNPFKKAKENDSKTQPLNESTTADSKMNFMEWFDENRTRLQLDNPLLKDSELAVVAMKQYRLRVQASSNTSDDLFQASNKDKVQMAKKKSTEEVFGMENHITAQATVNEDDTTAIPRKRKNPADFNDDQSMPKKKSNSAASKLKAFSFSKS